MIRSAREYFGSDSEIDEWHSWANSLREQTAPLFCKLRVFIPIYLNLKPTRQDDIFDINLEDNPKLY